MKKVLNVTVILTIFAIILRANTMEGKMNFEIGVCIFLLSFLASTVIVTISEVMKIDKEVAEENKQYTELYTNHKTAQMIDQKDSLED